MQIWVVQRYEQEDIYNIPVLLGVFSNEEKADELVAAKNKTNKDRFHSFEKEGPFEIDMEIGGN